MQMFLECGQRFRGCWPDWYRLGWAVPCNRSSRCPGGPVTTHPLCPPSCSISTLMSYGHPTFVRVERIRLDRPTDPQRTLTGQRCVIEPAERYPTSSCSAPWRGWPPRQTKTINRLLGSMYPAAGSVYGAAMPKSRARSETPPSSRGPQIRLHPDKASTHSSRAGERAGRRCGLSRRRPVLGCGPHHRRAHLRPGIDSGHFRPVDRSDCRSDGGDGLAALWLPAGVGAGVGWSRFRG